MEKDDHAESFDTVMQPIKANPNLLVIFNEIRKNGPTPKSRAGLGLHVSKPTRYALMQELVAGNLLIEESSSQTSRHRHSSILRVVKDRFFSLGVDIHMEGIEAVLVDIDSDVKSRIFLPNRIDEKAGIAWESRSAVIERIRDAVGRILRETGIGNHQVVSTGISSAGTVHGSDGIVMYSRYMPEWSEVPVGSILSRVVSAPTRLARDVNMMALAEIRALGLRQLPNALCVALRRGIGLGTIIHGRMYTGQTGNAGEWSQLSLFPTLQGGQLRRQDLDTLIGFGAIMDLLPAKPMAEDIAGTRPGDARAQAVFDAFEADRPEVLPGMRQYIEQLGVHLANLVYIFDIDHVIIAGRFVFCGERFLSELDRQVRGHLRKYQDIHIVKGLLGMGAAALGAAFMAQETVFNLDGEILP